MGVYFVHCFGVYWFGWSWCFSLASSTRSDPDGVRNISPHWSQRSISTSVTVMVWLSADVSNPSSVATRSPPSHRGHGIMSRQFPVWVFILFIGFDWLKWCFSSRSGWLLQQLQVLSRRLLCLVRFLSCRFARFLHSQGLSLAGIWSRLCCRSWFLVLRLSWLVGFVYALFCSALRSDAFKLFSLIGNPDLHPNVSRLSYLQSAACLMLWRDYQSMFFMFLR